MRVFHCDHCANAIFFENSVCTKCGHKLAYLPDLKVVASLDALKDSQDLWTSPIRRSEGRPYRLCANYVNHNICNWAVPSDDANPLCQSCRLTTVIPDLSVAGNENAWRRLEIAKRRMMYSLFEFHLPIVSRKEDPKNGLAFQFMGDPKVGPRVLTGHADGVITVNIDEADDVQREKRRISMHEPYRTLLGHFRHEIGHYYWDLVIKNNEQRLAAFRDQFGDERKNYDQALRDHYANGPIANWQMSFVSDYASVHPWEDWAETWAHYLHITDTLETASVCGISLTPARKDEPQMRLQPNKPLSEQRFSEIIEAWFPLTYVLNCLNRGMGLNDAYPFVLTPAAVDKLRFIHENICAASG